MYRPFRVLIIGAEQDALAQRQAVRLDHSRIPVLLADVPQGLGRILEYLIPGGGDAVGFHEVFRKYLAAFQDRGIRPGAEGGDPCLLQGVYHPGHQRVVRRYQDQVRPAFPSQGYYAVHIGGGHVKTGRVTRNAAVAGGAEQAPAAGAFLQFADDRVFPSAAADNQNISFFHWPNLTLSRFISTWV